VLIVLDQGSAEPLSDQLSAALARRIHRGSLALVRRGRQLGFGDASIKGALNRALREH
jgi:hypothetical protein